MIEIAIAILVVGCIIYIFKSDFIIRDVCVTVIESLPLSIFKKWVKEDSKIKSDNILKDERNKVISIKDNGYENIVDFNKEVLNEVAITKIEQDIEVIEEENIIEENNVNEEENIDEDIRIDTTKDIEEVINTNINNSFEGNLKEVSNNSEESIESKEIIEDTNEEIKEIDKSSEEVDEEANNLDDILNLVSEELVFWTPNGKTYHTKNTCRSLSRSKIINSGTVYESGKDFKCENCK